MTRSLASLPINLNLFDRLKHGSAPLGSVKAQLGPTWRRSIRSRGGFWTATADWAGDMGAARELFLNGLAYEIQETLGGVITWQGLLVEMDLTLGGMTYVRRWLDLANSVQVIYAKLGDNLLTNGSVESGAWSPNWNTPDTNAQSSAWVADGSFSQHIVCTSFPSGGSYIQQSITIKAGVAYDFQMSVKVVLGAWTLDIVKHAAGPDGNGNPTSILASGSTSGLGQAIVRASISASNTYAGLVDIIIYNNETPAHNAEIFCDLASLRVSAAQARTAIYTDAQSQTDYGLLQLTLLQSSMSDDTANAHAQTAMQENRWPRTVPPASFGVVGAAADGLKLTFAGYAWTMRNKYVPSTIVSGTTQNASVHVTNIAADCEQIVLGKVEPNTMQYQVDDRAPLRELSVIEAITLAGDLAGNRWTWGVYGGRLFRYKPASTTPDYHFNSGKLLNPAGGEMEPWLARPGLVYVDDLPAGAGALTANAADDPHVVFVEEVEFDCASWLAGGSGLILNPIAGSNQAA